MPAFLMKLHTRSLLHVGWLILCLLQLSVASAQVTAGFTADKTGGCSPLTVSFANTSSGAGISATYTWDLGNGSFSYNKNASATYTEEKTYTVTLTVADNGREYTRSMQVVVARKPVANFTVSASSGCIPFGVTFTSTSQPGDGTLSSFVWEYGDGYAERTSSGTTSHTYTRESVPSVTLTAINSYGCASAVYKKAVTEVLPPLAAVFTSDKAVLCTLNDAVAFTNTSYGPGTLQYKWDFGDGKTSAEKDPKHVYASKGEYQVSLTTSNNKGCTQTTQLPAKLNVASYTADITVPAPICTGASVSFGSTVYPYTYNQQWTFADGDIYSPYAYKYFTTGGTQTVKLKAVFDKCPLEVTKTFTVHTTPDLKGFEINSNAPCGAPSTVAYKDTSSWAVSWAWSFYNGNTVNSSIRNPSVNYTYDGVFSAYLTAKDANGCTATGSGSVLIGRPSVATSYTSSTATGGGVTNCGAFSVSFKASVNIGSIQSYKWSNGVSTSTVAEPTFDFTTPGYYNVTLTYVTDKGCTGTTTGIPVTVFKRPQAAFSGSTSVCGNSTANYNASDGAIDHTWSAYNTKNNVFFYSGGSYPSVVFPDTGVYTVKLISYNGYDKGCSDTVIKTDYVKVLPPFAGTINYTNTCDGTRGAVTFTENSQQVEKWDWDFGDGGTMTYAKADKPAQVVHTYKATGTYIVRLKVTNGDCVLSTERTAQVLLKQKPVLTASNTTICNNETIDIQLNGFEVNPSVTWSESNFYYFTQLQYNDGTPFTGTNNNTTPGTGTYYHYWRTNYTGILGNIEGGKNAIRVITTSAGFNCQDTSNYVAIQVNRPTPAFKVVKDSVCNKQANVLEDLSKASNSNKIIKWQWSFGDGEYTEYTQFTRQVSHVYKNVGNYGVNLTVTDNQGCTSSTYGNVVMAGPIADFSFYPTAGTPKNTVYVSNYTRSVYDYLYPNDYKWRFSISKTTSDQYTPPGLTYTKAPDNDTITLIASNTRSHCADTAVKVLPVINMNTAFTMNTSFLHSTGCLPVFVQFTNTSYNVTGVIWDFGDGTGLEDLSNYNRNPGHIYREPGVYKVTLYGFNTYYNSKDTTVDSVIIRPAATAQVTSNITESCTAQDVQLKLLSSTNVTEFTWDFGDGILEAVRGNSALHRYETAGIYQPVIIAKNGNGCPYSFATPAPILVDSLHITIQSKPPFICDSATVGFQPVVKNLGADKLGKALYYHWSFGTQRPADTANEATPSFYYNRAGVYNTTLRVRSEAGCVKETSATVTVVTTPVTSITALKEICANESLVFTGKASPAPENWQWQFGNGESAGVQDAGAISYRQAGTYQIRLVADNKGCTDTALHTLEVRPLPLVAPMNDTAVVIGATVPLRAAGRNDIVRWNWLPMGDAVCPTCAVTTAVPSRHTTYEVTGWTKYGCSASQSFHVRLLCAATPIFIPNTFTPNKDGRNDLFYPRGKGVKLVKFFRIYNRMGEMIFERRNFQLNDASQGWDGTYLGKTLGNEVLAYASEMVCNAGETFSIKGSVMLIR
ncbi:PKD domain-containing protein [Filimonas zeae]|uniref:PKD domain-containing protein n=1 Tax=Filimonas zeae TaxID=1737353 RepID=UPI00166A3BED|nr:PKD domain-containing protein [Filimonas zeae]